MEGACRLLMFYYPELVAKGPIVFKTCWFPHKSDPENDDFDMNFASSLHGVLDEI